MEPLADQLLAELSTAPTHLVVAWRGNRRYLQTFEPVRLESGEPAWPPTWNTTLTCLTPKPSSACSS